jgi:hypothetical protein
MSYCRFENTVMDLRDCYDALCDMQDLDDLSEYEKKAAIKLIKLCARITEQCEGME